MRKLTRDLKEPKYMNNVVEFIKPISKHAAFDDNGRLITPIDRTDLVRQLFLSIHLLKHSALGALNLPNGFQIDEDLETMGRISIWYQEHPTPVLQIARNATDVECLLELAGLLGYSTSNSSITWMLNKITNDLSVFNVPNSKVDDLFDDIIAAFCQVAVDTENQADEWDWLQAAFGKIDIHQEVVECPGIKQKMIITYPIVDGERVHFDREHEYSLENNPSSIYGMMVDTIVKGIMK